MEGAGRFLLVCRQEFMSKHSWGHLIWSRQSYDLPVSGLQVRWSKAGGIFYDSLFGSYLFILWLSRHTNGNEIGCLKKREVGLGL